MICIHQKVFERTVIGANYQRLFSNFEEIMNHSLLITCIVILLVVTGILLYLSILYHKRLRRHRRQQTSWQEIFEELPDLLILVNQQQQIEMIQSGTNMVLNHSAGHYQGKTLSYLFKQEDMDELHEFSSELFVNIDKSITYESFKRTGSDINQHIEFRIIPLPVSKGKYKKVLVLGRDITPRKQVEKKLQFEKERAEESDKLKSAFLANMSHEIRTPLNAIVGFANLVLEDDLSPDEKEKYFRYINRNSNQLINLITDIIDLSKIESQQLEIVPSSFNLNQHLCEIEEVIKYEKQNREKDHLLLFLELDMDDETAEIYADPYRIRQVMINLLINAIKFTNKGFIQFGYRRAEHQRLLFYVRDSGIGIPAEKQDLVFEHFRQIESDLTKLSGGTGLGLAICKNLVTLMKGRMWMESEQGKGSTFYFSIPYLRSQDKD